jgi:hypothetical protein
LKEWAKEPLGADLRHSSYPVVLPSGLVRGRDEHTEEHTDLRKRKVLDEIER